jgi:hypothetical protein
MDDTADARRAATSEARWFAPGAPPAAVLRWFEAGGVVRREPTRTDRYLRLDGVHGVGVKHRAGRLEIKARRAEPAATVVWAGRPAPLEAWLKWSAPAAALAHDAVAPVDVAKRRRLLDRHGVQVELAELALMGHRWWTFGLEAATGPGVEAVLASAWAATAPRAAPLWAGAYPAWLDHVARA